METGLASTALEAVAVLARGGLRPLIVFGAFRGRSYHATRASRQASRVAGICSASGMFDRHACHVSRGSLTTNAGGGARAIHKTRIKCHANHASNPRMRILTRARVG